MTSPKAASCSALVQDRILRNAGYGLHSNDIRARHHVDPNDKVTPLDRVPLLVRSRGAEAACAPRRSKG